MRVRWKPTIPDVEPLIRAYYAQPGNGTGGKLHAVLDDGNVRRSDVELARHYAWEEGDLVALGIIDLLLLMTISQRRRLSYMRFYSS